MGREHHHPPSFCHKDCVVRHQHFHGSVVRHQHGHGDHGQVAEHLAARPEGEPERRGGWRGGGGGGEGRHQEDQQGISDYQDIQ